tara:strand:- start:9486 stop:10301 length:816 start_codon:yes stop_codon:yes gene_type:complete
MNYYPHHIGDFNSATRHLSRIERSVYRDLIDLYYDTEKALSEDQASLCRLIIARSSEEVEAVKQVLAEFFTLGEDGYSHSRCDQEIEKYQAKARQAQENGKRGGRPKKPEAPQQQPDNNPEETQPVNSGFPEESGSQANQEPRTNNQTNQGQKICAADAPPTQAKAKRLAADWMLPDDWFAWAVKTRPELGEDGVRTEALKFADHWHAASKNAAKLDWLATWRNWVRNANAPRNVHSITKSRFNNIPKVNAAELNARADEAKRLGVVRANF